MKSQAYASKDLKGLAVSENPLNLVNRIHNLLKMFLNAHSGFNREELQGYLNLYSFVINPPADHLEKVEKIIKMVQSLIVAVGTVMLPRISAMFSKNEDNQSRKYFDTAMEAVIIYVSVVIFGIMSIKEVFTDVYFGEGYAKTSVLLGYLIVTVFFFGIGNVLRTQYLIPKKLDKIYIHSAIFGAVLNLVANFILIPFMASTGASIATIIAEVSVCCYQFYMVRKDI